MPPRPSTTPRPPAPPSSTAGSDATTTAPRQRGRLPDPGDLRAYSAIISCSAHDLRIEAPSLKDFKGNYTKYLSALAVYAALVDSRREHQIALQKGRERVRKEAVDISRRAALEKHAAKLPPSIKADIPKPRTATRADLVDSLKTVREVAKKISLTAAQRKKRNAKDRARKRRKAARELTKTAATAVTNMKAVKANNLVAKALSSEQGPLLANSGWTVVQRSRGRKRSASAPPRKPPVRPSPG